VCSRDRVDLLSAALPRLAEALRDGDELIVVDSASLSAEVALAAESAGARVLRAGQAGASIARNVGAGAATSPVVVFTDDDCEPQPGWLAAIAASFATPEVGFAYGAVLDSGGGPALSVTEHQRAHRFAAGDVRAIDAFGHGANLAVRREALTAVGGWEARLGAGVRLAGGEDADLVLRLLRAGWAGVFEPAAAVRHTTWRGRRAALRTVWGYGRGAGAVAVRAHRADGDWWLLRHELGPRGFGAIRRDLKARYEFGVASGLARTAGVVVGALLTLGGAA